MSPSLDPGSVLRTCLPGKLHQFVAVLADEPLLVVTGDVVPDSSVPVEVVEDGNAGLVMFPLQPELPVVGLRLPVPPGLAPVPCHVPVPAAQPHVRSRPEPAW